VLSLALLNPPEVTDTQKSGSPPPTRHDKKPSRAAFVAHPVTAFAAIGSIAIAGSKEARGNQ